MRRREIAIEAGSILDGSLSQTTSFKWILVADDSIVDLFVSKEELLRCCEDKSKLVLYSFPNATLTPGLIDTHVHLAMADTGAMNYQLWSGKTSESYKAYLALHNAQRLLRAGWTTIRGAGDSGSGVPTLDLAKAIKDGLHKGPRIVGAGHYLSITGGGGDVHLPGLPCKHPQLDGTIVDGPEEARKAVRSEIAQGANWIKLLVSGAFMSESDSPMATSFAPDELSVISSESKRLGVPIMAHAHGAGAIVDAIEILGARTVEHASFIDEAGIKAALEHGTWLILTMAVDVYFFEKEAEIQVTMPKAAALARELDAARRASARACIEAGCKIAVGSDFIGWSDATLSAVEFTELEALGLSRPASFHAGTGGAAEAIGLEAITGTLRPGLSADIVVWESNPLDDLKVLRSAPLFVMARGDVIVGEER